MAFFWRHKILSLFVAALVFYLYSNPPGRFGMVKYGIVVFNRIPVIFFDLYVNPDGGMALEADLLKKSNVKYWQDNHLKVSKAEDQNTVLLVGTGFYKTSFSLNPSLIPVLRRMGLTIRQLPSAQAVLEYNKLRAKGVPVSILLKIK